MPGPGKTEEPTDTKKKPPVVKKPVAKEPSVKEDEISQEELEHLLDQANEDTFPASDAPPTSPMTSLGRHAQRKKNNNQNKS